MTFFYSLYCWLWTCWTISNLVFLRLTFEHVITRNLNNCGYNSLYPEFDRNFLKFNNKFYNKISANIQRYQNKIKYFSNIFVIGTLSHIVLVSSWMPQYAIDSLDDFISACISFSLFDQWINDDKTLICIIYDSIL